ncbi:MAG TPA: response regulator, partial [Mycobacteriales bacterium]|nr:response regulator [Mycobacteriales bacterium]
VAANKVGGLIDAVGEAELGARHHEQIVDRAAGVARETSHLAVELERALDGLPEPPEGRAALANLRAAGDELARDATAAGELAEDHRARVAGVRDGTLALAMVPLRQLVGGFPTLVHRLATAAGSDVRLLLDGADVELDKRVLDGVSEALTHLVTNAVDHGCEPPLERRAAGKPEQATVHVSARSSGSTVVLEVRDDGRGVDETAVRAEAEARGLTVTADVTGLLFTPSFSTRSEVTESSGRGVGLDAVRHAVEGLGGTVELASTPGRGTTVTLTVPVSLGVLHCLLARAGGERYAIPVTSVIETIGLRDSDIGDVAGTPVVLRDGGTMPLRNLADSLGAAGHVVGSRSGLVVRHGDRLVVWAVDRLEGEQEVVVKDLGPFFAAAGGLPGITGATLDGDGSVVCLLDLREIGDGVARARAAVPTQRVDDDVELAPARVLVVEDSLGVRELERVVLSSAGYDVTTCVDGAEGAAELTGNPYDAVVSDVEMPGLDGVELTRRIRATAGWEQVPVVLLTSRGAPEDVKAGLDAGANAYLLKSDFNQAELVATVRRLIGR